MIRDKSLHSFPRAHRANKKSLPRLMAISFTALAIMTLNLLPNPMRRVVAAQETGGQLSDSVLNQMRSLTEAKRGRSLEQRKIDSNLLAAIKMNRGEAIAANVPDLQPDVKLEANGKVLVDMTAMVTDALLEQLKAAGAEDILAFRQYDAIRARLPLAQLESLAASKNIRAISRAVEAQTAGATKEELAMRAVESRAFAARASGVRAQLPQAMRAVTPQNNPNPVPHIGSVTSAGDTAHAAAAARAMFGVNGAGVKIGVLSDSYNNQGGAELNVMSGDLPGVGNPNGFTTPVTVLQDFSFGGVDRGRAMLQIIHDLAPGAQLYFATGTIGAAGFADNIQALRDSGCDIIIDDVFYVDESPFQDDLIAQAVNRVTNAGALYFSSAGDAGNLTNGTSGVWEGDFKDSGVDLISGANNLGRLHEFSTGVTLNTVNPGGSSRRLDMMWSDPLAGSANDYDVYVLNAAGTSILRASNSDQTGTQDPYETIGSLNVGEKIAIVKFSGAARALHLSTGRARLSLATSGQVRGHACAMDAFCVAAVDVATASFGPFVGGDVNPVEPFSSDGTRRIFYNANGLAITPGNVLFATGGGVVRQKPDIAAADGVATTLPPASGLNPFFGTSAAAAHAGAVAALLKQFRPAGGALQIRSILSETTLDVDPAGIDRDSGFGIVMALPALELQLIAGTDTLGVYTAAERTFYLRNSNTLGNADIQVQYGPSGSVPVYGDWNADGVATIGVYETATRTFYLRNSNSVGPADITFSYGPAGAIPIVGDWNGDGATTIGVYDPATQTFYLRNSNSAGNADLQIQYGPPASVPVVGDWDGDGKTTIGVYDPATRTFYLRNTNSQGNADIQVQYGPNGAVPVVGDFDGNVTTTIGVYDPATRTFYLRNGNSAGNADITIQYGPNSSTPLAGDWDGQ